MSRVWNVGMGLLSQSRLSVAQCTTGELLLEGILLQSPGALHLPDISNRSQPEKVTDS